MKRRLLVICMLATMLLIATSMWIGAEAEDTYNFYFQKAPGPVTVNQGAAPQPTTNAPAASAATGAATAAPAPAANATVAAAPTEPATPAGTPSFELSLGIAGSSAGSGTSEDPYTKRSLPGFRSGMINGAHATVGVQWNFNEALAIQGEAFYLLGNKNVDYRGTMLATQGSPWDFGASFVITPLRFPLGSGVKGFISGLVGGMSVPFHAQGFSTTGAADGLSPRIAHAGTFAYGLRAGLAFGNRIAFQATARRLDRYSSTQGTGSLVFLF